MQIGTYLKDYRNSVEYVLYGDDGDYAVLTSPHHLNQDSCGLVKVPWKYLSSTGQIAPIGSIPSKWHPMKGLF